MKLKVKTKDVDDELMYRRQKIKLGGESIYTPLRSTSKGIDIEESINEIYGEFTFDSLENFQKDEEAERRKNSRLSRKEKDNFNFFIPAYRSLTLPDEEKIGTLSDLQYEHTDVIITPLWKSIVKNMDKGNLDPIEGLGEYKDLTETFIGIVETLNNKTIVGNIPTKIPRDYLNNLLDFYHDNDITSFVLDFDGTSISTNRSWIRQLFRTLIGYGIMDESLIYSINMYKGRFSSHRDSTLAKDFIVSGYGIDALGDNHKRIPPEVFEVTGDEEEEKRSHKIFDRDRWGYLRYDAEKLVDELGFRVENINDQKKKYNIKEQYKETLKLQEEIGKQSTIESYVESKGEVTDQLIDEMSRDDILDEKQSRLSSFK